LGIKPFGERTKALEPDEIRESIAATEYESMVGPVQWKRGRRRTYAALPVGSQWQAAGVVTR
jgi:hypothetical protein